MANKTLEVWCVERFDPPNTKYNNTDKPLHSYFAGDCWVKWGSRGCQPLTKGRARAICKDYATDKTDPATYRARRI